MLVSRGAGPASPVARRPPLCCGAWATFLGGFAKRQPNVRPDVPRRTPPRILSVPSPGIEAQPIRRIDVMNTTAFELVRAVVQEMSGELGYEALVNPEPDTPLYGNSGVDSLSLVSIVAGVERAAEDRFQRRVVLADERAMSRRSSPYRTVGTLAELLHERLVE